MSIDLEGIEGVNVRKNVSLAPLTTIETGGRARLVVEVEFKEILSEVVRRARASGFGTSDTFILGGGTNLLVSDEGFEGIIIKLFGEFTRIEVQGTRITVGGAATLMKVISAAEEAGLGGLEFLAGIPGTLGGAIAMNAGAWGKGIWDITVQVIGVDEKGNDCVIRPDSHGVKYRSGNLPGGFIVSEAVLECEEVGSEEVTRRVREVLGMRRLLGDDELRTFGSVFKNPEGDYAGRLLDEVGVKGLTRGGAMVSRDHANFILNTGNATSGDVLELIKIMKRRVMDNFGIELIPEVILLGFDEDAIKD
jgi:UDP-N-acetylmuramate dehydrogenase